MVWAVARMVFKEKMLIVPVAKFVAKQGKKDVSAIHILHVIARAASEFKFFRKYNIQTKIQAA